MAVAMELRSNENVNMSREIQWKDKHCRIPRQYFAE